MSPYVTPAIRNFRMKRTAFLMMLGAFTLLGCRTSIGTTVRSYGYSELRPPSTLAAPGTLVYLRSSSPAQVAIVCTAKDAFGSALQIVQSDSAEIALTQELSIGAKLDASYLEKIKGNATYADVRDVTVLFTNVHVFEVPDAGVFEAVANRTPSCSQAKSTREKDGRRVTLVKSVIQADVNYVLSFKRDLDIVVKDTIAKQLAAELGVSGSQITNGTIRGSGLYWGVIDDPLLGRVNRPGEPVLRRPRRRVLPSIVSLLR